MIVDSSVLIAMLMKESEQFAFSDAITLAEQPCISAPTLLETAIVSEGRGGTQGGADLDHLVAKLGLRVVPFKAEHYKIARDAFRRFGKGRHPARLNFGDCITYALARERGEPLLFKGEDFSQTDIESAAY